MTTLGLPLLHVAQTVVESTTVHGGVVAGASAAFGASALAIWRVPGVAAIRRLVRRRPRRRLAQVFAGALIALAVLPSVLPYDHLLPHIAAAESHSPHEAAAAHASHCHDTPGSCADAPVSAGPGQFLATGPLIVVPALLLLALLFPAAVLSGISRRPDVPVPLLAHVA